MSPRGAGRRFAAVLFTDIVGSTDIARALGDARWQALVRRHHAIVRGELKRFGGKELDTAGDGFFAMFESPGNAIRCAAAICEAVREIGLELRTGVHGGELETGDEKPGGIAVNTAARVMSVAGPGEVFVSSSLRDVVAGSSLEFHDHGLHHLKGIEDEWRLYSLEAVDGHQLADPIDPDEADRRRRAIESTMPDRRRPRRLAIWLGGVTVLAAILMLVTVMREDEPPPEGPATGTALDGPRPDSLVKLDPRTGQLLRVRSDLPATARAVSHDLDAGAGSVWLIRSPNVLKVDPQDGSSTPVRGISGLLTTGVDASDAGVWFVGGTLYQVDPGTGVAGDPIAFRPPNVPTPTTAEDLAVGFGRVWITLSQGYVIAVDPHTEDADVIDVGETPDAIAIGSDAVWVLDEFAGAVWRIDPGTQRIVDRIRLSGGLDRLAIGEGFVWVLDTTLGSLTPIVETSGDVHSAIPVGTEAADVVVGLGSVWIASGGDVLEVDPVAPRVERTIDVGDTPILRLTVDATDGTIWLDVGPAS